MQHLLTPFSKKIESYVWWEKAFTDNELSYLQNKAKSSAQAAEVGSANKGGVNESIRRSKTDWLHNNQETNWLFFRLGEIASKLNANYFGFDLVGFGEPLQLTHYDQIEKGMYGWHQDYNAQVSRKLSLVLQLSDPSEYEGGNLQIMTGVEPQNVKKERGLLVAFPSYVVHQVTPVTQGTRQSLVAWISGPQFK
jgi:PKHD-type hydroxylase